ncbi:MAG: hypothetical protein MJ131_11160 [Lachnospiraceae bacterium]|nr:hypothetical protein [Lachnospiraceae bacterium]
MKKKKFLIAFIFLMAFGFGIAAYAVDWTAQLKTFMQSEKTYYSTSIETLSRQQNSNKTGFKSSYGDRYVVVSGTIASDSVASTKREMNIYDYGVKAKINLTKSSLQILAGRLNTGDIVTVYGQLKIKGWNEDSFEITADYIDVNGYYVPYDSYVFYGSSSMNGQLINSLTKDGRIEFAVPRTWTDDYVMSSLTNNGINGYQFSLNAISPQNINYPENFYIFYFDYKTYLDYPPSNPTKGDRHDIEELVIKNIVDSLGGDFDVDVEDFKASSGKEYDYYLTKYRPKDGNDYRLEFIFVPDANKGFVCMLYLYYPKEGESAHVNEVAYAIETLSVGK